MTRGEKVQRDWGDVGMVLGCIGGALILTLPMWMILLGVI